MSEETSPTQETRPSALRKEVPRDPLGGSPIHEPPGKQPRREELGMDVSGGGGGAASVEGSGLEAGGPGSGGGGSSAGVNGIPPFPGVAASPPGFGSGGAFGGQGVEAGFCSNCIWPGSKWIFPGWRFLTCQLLARTCRRLVPDATSWSIWFC